mgnify:CR=1 FL=1
MDFLAKKNIYLAAGLQSGGTTLISHCFLKHEGLNGVLDMGTDLIQVNFSRVSTPEIWVKMTVSSFRCQEAIEVYENFGHSVKPLLIVRNPFDVWASLKTKWYGLNSLTAEDPPLFLRFKRFLEDWRYFRERNLPIVCFEEFSSDPETALRETCNKLGLSYSDVMISNAIGIEDIAYVTEANPSFIKNLSGELISGISQDTKSLSSDEIQWISKNMRDLISHYGYHNRHTIEPHHQEFLPLPFKNRRNLGWGKAAHHYALDEKINYMLECAQKAQREGLLIWLYGPGLFGEHLHAILKSVSIEIAGYIDSQIEVSAHIDGKPIFSEEILAKQLNNFVIICSFVNANSIEDLLLTDCSMAKESIFSFSRGP